MSAEGGGELTQDEIDFVDEIRKASIHPTGLGDFIEYEMSRPDAWEALERILTTRLAAARAEALRAARDEINEWRPTDINSAAQSGYVDCLSDVWNELTYRADGGGS